MAVALNVVPFATAQSSTEYIYLNGRPIATESASATILAQPLYIQDCAGTGTGVTTLNFSTHNVPVVSIRVGSANGPVLGDFQTSTGSAVTGNWVVDGTQFFLVDKSAGATANEIVLASVTVHVGSSGCPGTLTANPSLVPHCGTSAPDTTTLTWSAPGHQNTAIRINTIDGPQMTTGGPSGSQMTGAWISDGMKFLLVDTSTNAVLAVWTASLDRTACIVSGTLTANPSAPVGQCTTGYASTTLSWTATSGVSATDVRVGSSSGTIFGSNNSGGASATTGLWVTDGMQFFLQDASSGDSTGDSKTLASLVVQTVNTGCTITICPHAETVLNLPGAHAYFTGCGTNQGEFLTWSLDQAVGSINSSGAYYPPSPFVAGELNVIGASQFSPSETGSAGILLSTTGVSFDNVRPDNSSVAAGATVKFTMKFSDTQGADDLEYMYLSIQPTDTLVLPNTCTILFHLPSRTAYLENDAGDKGASLTNSQCTLLSTSITPFTSADYSVTASFEVSILASGQLSGGPRPYFALGTTSDHTLYYWTKQGILSVSH